MGCQRCREGLFKPKKDLEQDFQPGGALGRSGYGRLGAEDRGPQIVGWGPPGLGKGKEDPVQAREAAPNLSWNLDPADQAAELSREEERGGRAPSQPRPGLQRQRAWSLGLTSGCPGAQDEHEGGEDVPGAQGPRNHTVAEFLEARLAQGQEQASGVACRRRRETR